MQRRKFILGVGAASAVAIAGCSDDGDSGGGGGGGGGPDTSSPTAIVESYYQEADNISQDASAEEALSQVENHLHSLSPIPDILEEEGMGEGESQNRSLASVSASVTEEDLGADALNNQFGLGFFGVSEDDLSTIAEENAVVEAEIEYEEAESQTQSHLTATEGGDWLIVV